MLNSAGGVSLRTRKGRTATVQPLTMLINSEAVDSALALRAQRLRSLGITGGRVNLIAGAAWGEVRNA